jgi:GntR family transcriptional regulator
MQIRVDPKSDRSPSEQLAEQVRFAVAAGELAVGERLPSVRQLALDALVNPNTVGKAWRDLEREGVLASRPGDGVFVAANAPAICAAARDAVLRERLERVVDEALSAGLSRTALEDWFEHTLARRKGWKRAGGQ